jgi:hypothetical protein
VSARNKNAPHVVVSRTYRPCAEACTLAVELLLKHSKIKKAAGPSQKPDGHNDAMKGSKDDRARSIVPERS